MSVSLTGIHAPVATFFSWWLAELSAMWRPLNALVQRKTDALTLCASGEQWILQLHKGGRVKELGRVGSGSDLGNKKAVGTIVKNAKNANLKVLLPHDRVLRKVLDMPSITEAELREALSFEIDRQTPFRPDHVYFDYRILARRPEAKRLTVELTTVPRATVDAVLTQVREWGFQPSAVDVVARNSPYGAGLNLLKGSEETGARRSYLSAAPALLFILLLAAVVYIPINRLAAIDQSLSAQVAEEKMTAGQTSAMRDELEQTTKGARFLDERKKDVPSALLILDALTKALPDHTWLLTLNQNKTEVKISGYSAAAAELISALDAVPLFKKPAFTSPIVQDAQNKLERFEISFEVDVNGAAKP